MLRENRMRSSRNQADCGVIPMALATSQLLMPFLEFTTCHMTINHLSRTMGESSMMVPVFKVNCGESCFSRHFQRLYLSMNRTFLEPHFGQVTPSGQRCATRYSRQLTGAEQKT